MDTKHVNVCAVDLEVMAWCSGYKVIRGSGIWMGSGQGSMGSSRSAWSNSYSCSTGLATWYWDMEN